ncbi:carbohydrate-binding protein [Hymenobacter jeollabukensis]|uniref:Carbohydrate-binding protein n=1 Tax=Hymenobacter jeollabukensis TaxID=2025313 RepID=A0A5R8WXP1_9BACT|nr:carbohydrate-binding protein [Hymenobacter jeollabukensis]TLM97139.1 carbohydrate-binding protein [Hymenobacter jeollabukensis]
MTTLLLTGRAGQWLRRSAQALAAGAGLAALSPSTALAQCNQIVWQDEFNTAGDLSKWRVYEGDGCAEGNCNFGNAELQAYRAANAAVAGGYLTITTRYEPSTVGGRNYAYTSAKLFSKTAAGALQTFRYGRIEASIKLPSGQGVWPAFWMLPDPGNWPSTGEIDIMEAKHKNPTSVAGTIHYDDNGWHFTGREATGTVDLSTGFHTYAVEWSPNQIKWFIDNTLYHTASPKTTSGGSWPFNDGNFYLMLNAAVGGPGTGFTGYQNPNPADYPTTMQVDFVRVYKGSYNYAVLGDETVYQNDTNKTYRLDAVTGATYSWSVPAGATITAGQGTNAIQVSWGSSAGGNVTVTTAVSGCPTGTYALGVTVSPALQLEKLYEDFEANRFITYASATGVLTQALTNPVSGGQNTSAKVAKYVRNTAEQYDVISLRNLTVGNANDFVAGRKKIYLDVYSTAPVGSKVTLQLENSAVTTATNFPLGRHSAYRAYTSRQNAWETLEFDLERSIDAGTSIYSIDNVTLLFQPATNSGATFYFDNLLVKQQPVPAIVSTDVLINYDGAARISQNAAKTNGAYTANFANPAATGVNTSARVAKYVRNSAEQYDVLFFDATPAGTIIEDAALFKNQTYQIQADVYTAAPVGTAVLLNLQNKAAAANTYPAGRNSTYEARTTVQNQWQTLTFNYVTSPDGGTANVAIDELAFLFGNNSLTGDTYYVDNIRIVKRAAAPTYAVAATFENYDATRNLTLLSANGTYAAVVNNPSATGINTSTKVGQYARNASEQYDVLAFRNLLTKDGAAYKNGDKAFAMDVYTSAPAGTVVSWQLESNAASRPQNYPTGRHSIYQAVVKQTNAWHTLVFTFASAPDPGTPDADVDNSVFLFAPNTLTGATFYIDNLRSLTKNGATNAAPSVSLTSPVSGASFAAPASIGLTASASDSDGSISKVEFYNGSTLLGTATTSPYSYTWTGVGAGNYSLSAKATDNAGAVTTSAAVSVTVSAAPTAQAIPGKIEAESFSTQSGTQTEATTDTGGGVNVDWFETGDWLDYSVNVAAAGQYTVDFRVASANGGATLQLRNSGGTVLGSINVGNTGGWQNWQTLSTTVTLPAGAQTLRLYAAASTGCNVNWLNFTAAAAAPNLALNKPTFTSSTENAGTPGSAAVDGNATSTRWSSAFSDPQWLYVDLGASYSVSRVKLTWEGAYGKDYLVQVSADAATWTTIRTVAGNATLVNDHTGLTGTGRYVRIYGTARGTAYGYSLYELEVYGTAAGGTNPGGTGLCTGTVANGDYSYEVSTTSGTVSWKFIPLTPIAGSTMALIYVKVGTGGYAGYQMTAAGSNFTFSQAQAAGAALSFYFTYRVGTSTAERNSSATPHSYTAGSTCTGSRPALASKAARAQAAPLAYPNPVREQLTVPLPTAEAATITLTDALGRVVLTQTTAAKQATATLDVQALRRGVYQLSVRSATSVQTQKIIKE